MQLAMVFVQETTGQVTSVGSAWLTVGDGSQIGGL